MFFINNFNFESILNFKEICNNEIYFYAIYLQFLKSDFDFNQIINELIIIMKNEKLNKEMTNILFLLSKNKSFNTANKLKIIMFLISNSNFLTENLSKDIEKQYISIINIIYSEINNFHIEYKEKLLLINSELLLFINNSKINKLLVEILHYHLIFLKEFEFETFQKFLNIIKEKINYTFINIKNYDSKFLFYFFNVWTYQIEIESSFFENIINKIDFNSCTQNKKTILKFFSALVI